MKKTSLIVAVMVMFTLLSLLLGGMAPVEAQQGALVKTFKVAFLLVYHPSDGMPPGDLPAQVANVDAIRINAPSAFEYATLGRATLDTTYPVQTMQVAEDVIYISQHAMSIATTFYQSHNDEFHLLAIYHYWPSLPGEPQSFAIIQNLAHGTGHEMWSFDGNEIFDRTADYGAGPGSPLLGVANMSDTHMSLNADNGGNGLLHEFGHAWGFFVTEPFDGQNGLQRDSSHIYRGLASPYTPFISTPLNSDPWESNGDGTYFRPWVNPATPRRYHPFMLYLMGLLPRVEWTDTHLLVDAGGYGGLPWNFSTAPEHSGVSVGTIVDYEGIRWSEDPCEAPPGPTSFCALVDSGIDEVTLSWVNSVDPNTVSYRIYRDGLFLAETVGSGYTDTSVSNGQTVTYTVRSYKSDCSDNYIADTSPITVTVRDITSDGCVDGEFGCVPTGFPDDDCNGVDDDCDLIPDDDYIAIPSSCGTGVCEGAGELQCQNGTIVDTCVVGSPTETPEVSCADGEDNDCDGLTDLNDGADCCTDTDGDGYAVEGGSCGLADCNDSDPDSYPGATELCDGLDNDCDMVVPADESDIDGDTYRVCENDCNDGDPAVNPGAVELCDGLDNNCDALVDEGCPSCADHTSKKSCKNDPTCEWVGISKNGYCQDAAP